MKSWALSMMKEQWKLAALFVLLPVILIACHTPDTNYQLKYTGTNCGCSLLATGAISSSGAGVNKGKHSYTLNLTFGNVSIANPVGSGAWVEKVTGSCITPATFNKTLTAGLAKWCIGCPAPTTCSFANGPGNSIDLQPIQQ